MRGWRSFIQIYFLEANKANKVKDYNFEGVISSKHDALSTEGGADRTRHNFKSGSITVGVSIATDRWLYILM